MNEVGFVDILPQPPSIELSSPHRISADVERKPTLRVLLVTEASCAGVGGHVLDLAKGLTEAGCESHLIYSDRRMDDSFAQRLRHLAIAGRHSLPMHRWPHWSDWRAAGAIRRYLRQNGPFDILHGHSTKAGGLTHLHESLKEFPRCIRRTVSSR